MTSPYLKVLKRKRKWTPSRVSGGSVVEGAEESIFRALALRSLELPVKDFLQQGLEKELPDIPGVIEALESNQKDEDKHDLGFQYIVDAHGTDLRAEREANRILNAWLTAPEHPILKAAILERAVFFVLLPFYRFTGTIGMRLLSADISRDEQTHVLLHGMCCHDLGIKTTPNLNRLRRDTVAWVMDGLRVNTENKYLDKDFWIKQSDNLYYNGKTEGLKATQRSVMPAFFETSNNNLPQYG